MNINNEIIREWFYRLPKGYAEAPYSESELTVLADVIAEHDNSIRKRIPEAVGLINEADPVSEIYVIDNIKSIGLPQDVNIQIISEYNKLSEQEKEEFNKNFRVHTIDSYISSGWQAFKKFFLVNIGGARGGMGNGEVSILLAVKDSRPGGTAQHDIVMPTGEWEVKELDSGKFDPAKVGSANKFELTNKIQKFYNEIVIPLSDIGDPYQSLKNMVDPESVEDLKELIKIFETRFIESIDNKNILSANEWKKTALHNWYEGFNELHNIFYKTNLDINIKDTRLTITATDQDQSFWISDEDAEAIKTSSGNKDTVMLSVGDPIDNINTNIQIWFNRVMRNEFIKNPQQYIFELNKIKDSFFNDILGLIYFNYRNPKPHLGKPEMFSIETLSQGRYRFVLKSAPSSQKYPYLQEQG